MKLGSIASAIKGFARGQTVFVVMSSRSKTARPLSVSISKAECDRVARQFKTEGLFPSACIRVGYVSGDEEVTTI
jgi:hypothetical protein